MNRLLPYNTFLDRTHPLHRLDPSGLEWDIDRQGKPRADAKCECGDTVEQLAEKIKLSAEEYHEWLKSEDGKGLPQTADIKILEDDRKFSVPNMGFIDVGTYAWGSTGWILYFYRMDLMKRWESDGLRVVESHPVLARDIKIRLKSKKIYRYAFMGHGGAGFLEGSDDVVLADTYTR